MATVLRGPVQTNYRRKKKTAAASASLDQAQATLLVAGSLPASLKTVLRRKPRKVSGITRRGRLLVISPASAGSASATSTASGAGLAQVPTVPTSTTIRRHPRRDASGTVRRGRLLVIPIPGAQGAASGTGTATARGAGGVAGTAAGTSLAISPGSGTGTGNTAGLGAAQGTGASWVSRVGATAGLAVGSAVGAARTAGIGQSVGTSTAGASPALQGIAHGFAEGTSAVSGVAPPPPVGAQGLAFGTGRALAFATRTSAGLIPILSAPLIAETTRTTGQGPYQTDRRVPRCARISDVYSFGQVFDYFVDDAGGRAEYGTGTLNTDGTIARSGIYWSTSGGVGGSPIDWPAGKRTIRVNPPGGATGAGAAPAGIKVNGFWSGTVGPSQKIERYRFVESAILIAGMVDSIMTCDTPVTVGYSNNFIDEVGNQFVDETGALFVDGVGGLPMLFDIRRNNMPIGTIEFQPGAASATFLLADNVIFQLGDLLEIVGPATAGEVADLVWTLSFNQGQIR